MIAGVGTWVLWVMREKRHSGHESAALIAVSSSHAYCWQIGSCTPGLSGGLVRARWTRFEHALGTTPALAFLSGQANEDAYRSISIGSHANVKMFHRLYAADGYENVYPLRYHELFGLLTDPYTGEECRAVSVLSQLGQSGVHLWH